MLARRADNELLSCPRADLADLRRDARIRLSGVSHPEAGLLTNAEVEAYVDRRDFHALTKHWFLTNGQRPSILFHLTENIPTELGLLAVATDLAERCGTREKAAAADIIDRLRPGL